MIMRAIRIHQNGGPEVMQIEEVAIRDPGADEVVVRNHAIGVNFSDVMHRSGDHPGRKIEFPAGIGQEGAGVIEAVGDAVTDFTVGDRVAYGTLPPDSYAEARVLAADRVVPLPDGVDFKTAAGLLLKGLTVDFLTRRSYSVAAGETVLFHAAAGGVGLIACQWLRHLGATVIGTVGSAEKADRARAHGCDHAILYGEEDFAERVMEITAGAGVPVIYDSVGQATFRGSLDCLAPLGHLVCFGAASGHIQPFAPGELGAKSLSLTWARLPTYTARREDLLDSAARVFDLVGKGVFADLVIREFAFEDAAKAHRRIEARESIGSTILIP
jgi:NADPH:quinone reductase